MVAGKTRGNKQEGVPSARASGGWSSDPTGSRGLGHPRGSGIRGWMESCRTQSSGQGGGAEAEVHGDNPHLAGFGEAREGRAQTSPGQCCRAKIPHPDVQT